MVGLWSSDKYVTTSLPLSFQATSLRLRLADICLVTLERLDGNFKAAMTK